MDRLLLLVHLELAESNVVKGEERLARVRDLIAGMQQESESRATAAAFLGHLEESQKLYLAARDWILRELALPQRPDDID